MERIKELIKFSLVGSSGIIVNMGLLYLLSDVGSLKIEFASPIAIETSILSNFFLNNLWTFKKRETKESITIRIVKFHLVTGLAGIVNYLVLLGLVKFAGLHAMLANLIGIFFGFIINYSLNSRWTWKESKQAKSGYHMKR